MKYGISKMFAIGLTVRAGWNGVAVKDGQTVDIYAGF